MDIELLRNFLEIARLGSMTKAASSLHISQPTLSVQMKSLEEVLGRKLFLQGRTESCHDGMKASSLKEEPLTS